MPARVSPAVALVLRHLLAGTAEAVERDRQSAAAAGGRPRPRAAHRRSGSGPVTARERALALRRCPPPGIAAAPDPYASDTSSVSDDEDDEDDVNDVGVDGAPRTPPPQPPSVGRARTTSMLGLVAADAAVGHLPSVHSRDPVGQTALHRFARDGDVDAVNLLLSAGADPHMLEWGTGMRPLQLAAAGGHTACVERLLAVPEPEADFQNRRGHSALHLAAAGPRGGEICALLLAAGAAAELRTLSGETALFIAAAAGRVGALQVLLPAATPKVVSLPRTTDGATPLHAAAASGHVECVLELLRAKANPDIAAVTGETALCWAAKHGHVAAVRALIDEGSAHLGGTYMDLRSAPGESFGALHSMFSPARPIVPQPVSPLHAACLHGRAECALTLLRAGAAEEVASLPGDTPIIVAQSRDTPGHRRCAAAVRIPPEHIQSCLVECHRGLEALPLPAQMANLAWIDVSGNKLKELPADWAALANSLVHLDVSHNELAALPPEMHVLTKLETLRVDHNKLTELPLWLGTKALGQLKTLTVAENPLVWPRTQSEDALAALKKTAQTTEPSRRFRLLVVGEQGAGKTELIRRLRLYAGGARWGSNWGSRYEGATRDSTLGIAVSMLSMPHDPVEAVAAAAGAGPSTMPAPLVCSVWDVSGIPAMDTLTREVFVDGNMVCVVVWNLARPSSSLARLHSWLVTLREKAPRAPVLLVATHLDQGPCRDETHVLRSRSKLAQMLPSCGVDVRAALELSSTTAAQGEQPLADLYRLIVSAASTGLGSYLPYRHLRAHQILWDALDGQERLCLSLDEAVRTLAPHAPAFGDRAAVVDMLRDLHRVGMLFYPNRVGDESLDGDLIWPDPQLLAVQLNTMADCCRAGVADASRIAGPVTDILVSHAVLHHAEVPRSALSQQPASHAPDPAPGSLVAATTAAAAVAAAAAAGTAESSSATSSPANNRRNTFAFGARSPAQRVPPVAELEQSEQASAQQRSRGDSAAGMLSAIAAGASGELSPGREKVDVLVLPELLPDGDGYRALWPLVTVDTLDTKASPPLPQVNLLFALLHPIPSHVYSHLVSSLLAGGFDEAVAGRRHVVARDNTTPIVVHWYQPSPSHLVLAVRAPTERIQEATLDARAKLKAYLEGRHWGTMLQEWMLCPMCVHRLELRSMVDPSGLVVATAGRIPLNPDSPLKVATGPAIKLCDHSLSELAPLWAGWEPTTARNFDAVGNPNAMHEIRDASLSRIGRSFSGAPCPALALILPEPDDWWAGRGTSFRLHLICSGSMGLCHFVDGHPGYKLRGQRDAWLSTLAPVLLLSLRHFERCGWPEYGSAHFGKWDGSNGAALPSPVRTGMSPQVAKGLTKMMAAGDLGVDVLAVYQALLARLEVHGTVDSIATSSTRGGTLRGRMKGFQPLYAADPIPHYVKLLQSLDKTPGWGGMAPVTNPLGERVWLCEACRKGHV